MNYTELADTLVRESGRYDLQNSDGTDNGLLRFVNSGQRMLDRKASINHSEARVYTTVEAGAYYLVVPECRMIESVWILRQGLGDAATRSPLREVEWDDMQMRYTNLAGANESGEPNEYALGSFRAAPSNKKNIALDMNVFTGFDDTFAAQNLDVNGVFFSPPADVEYGFQVVGRFYTASFGPLVTTSFWSGLYPELLIAAARFWMEVANRNTEGRRDWEAIIQDQLTDLDKDKIEQYCNAGLVMGDPL